VIPLYKRKKVVDFMVCSAEDYGVLSQYRWGINNKGYPMRWETRFDGSTRNVDPAHYVARRMVRDGHPHLCHNMVQFDHRMVCARINFNRRDVRRDNLRPVTAKVRARI
jgi:hypothetical protein